MSTLAATPRLALLFGSSLLARVALPFLGMGLFVHAQRLSGSFTVGGVVTAAYAVAVGLGGPPMGRLVDRRGQTLVLLGTAGASAVLLFALALLSKGTPVAVLAALAAALGILTPPAAACLRTVLPELVSDGDLLRTAYAVDASANEATWVIGPPLGLAVGAAWTPGAALAVAGIVLFLGTAGFALQPGSRRWRPAEQPPGRGGSLTSKGMRALVAVFFAVGLLFGAAEVGVTAAATAHGSAAAASPLLALWGVGGVIGGVVASRFFGGGAHTTKGLAAILLALTGTHTAIALTAGQLPVTAFVLVAAGATIAPAYATMYAIAEGAAPAGTLTEAFAWLATAAAVGGSLGAALAGVVADHAGPAAVFLIAGGAGLIAVAATIVRACPLGSALARGAVVDVPACAPAV
jgi:predicted MFS family arabinose efflux permease